MLITQIERCDKDDYENNVDKDDIDEEKDDEEDSPPRLGL